MCGVTGFWLDKNIALGNASEILTRMTKSLDHRGPDSHGHFLNSDDKYTENALTILNKYINKFPDKDFIFGSR